MKVLVYPHDLEMGGSQLNAIEIAAATRDLGHEVVVYGRPGILNRRIDELGLEFISSPPPSRRPTPSVVRDLRRLIKTRHFDVVHGYEWPPILEARLAVAATPATCVGTVMSMAVAPFIPQHIPLVVGTEQIAAVERAAGRRQVLVIEPPVDTTYNVPDLGLDVAGFRSSNDIPPDAFQVVSVTRLARELKLEGLLVAIDVVPTLGSNVVLTIVGDGSAAQQVHKAADAANRRAGRAAVVLTGQLEDPRTAYAAADVVLGMGGSALRAMSFGKPLIVQGEQGFWRTLTPESLPTFMWTGWFGLGSQDGEGAAALRSALVALMQDSDERAQLGRFGRETVVQRFGLDVAAQRQVRLYGQARGQQDLGATDLSSDVLGLASFVAHTARRAVRRRTGNVPTDDFNSAPAVARPAIR